MSSYLHGEIFIVGFAKNQCLVFFFFHIFINDLRVSIVTHFQPTFQVIVHSESL